MADQAVAKKKRKSIPIILGIVVLLSSYVLPQVGEIGHAGWASIAIIVFAIVFWATEVIPPALTGMAILSLIPIMGVMGYQETFSSLGTVMIWRLMAIFILTSAIQKVGLADRIAYRILLFTKGNVKTTLFCFLLLNFVLSFIIPNSVARTTLCVTVIASYLETANVSKEGNIGKAFMITLPAASAITASAIMVGASVDIFAAHIFHTMVGYTWTYMSWMIVNVPFCLAMTFMIFLVAIFVFPPEEKRIIHGDDVIRKKIEDLGRMRSKEWFVIIVFCALLVMWFSDISETVPAEMAAAFLVVIPHRWRSLEWKEAMKAIKWDILLLFGASIAMATALRQSGAVAWLAESLFSHLSGISPAILVVMVVTMTMLVRLGMTNMTGAAAVLLPLLLTAAIGIGVNPVWLGMICVVSCCGAFFYPAQSANSLFAYNFGYYQAKHMMKFGLILFVVFNVTLIPIAMFYWPLVGVPILL